MGRISESASRSCQAVFVKLLVKRAWLCMCIWLLIPGLLAAMVLPIRLTDPLKGWRIRDHATAEALDGLILASDQSVAKRGIQYVVSPPASPPSPPPPARPMPPPRSTQAAIAQQTVHFGEIKLLVEARDGGNVLKSSNLEELVRLEQAVLAWLERHGLCQLQHDSANGGWSCRPPSSATLFLPPASELDECVAHASITELWPGTPFPSSHASSSGAATFARDECTERGFAWRVEHNVMSHQLYNCTDDYFATGATCDWTYHWSCPGDWPGEAGFASPDGSIGFFCCCVQQREQPDSKSHMGARAAAAREIDLWATAIDAGVLETGRGRAAIAQLQSLLQQLSWPRQSSTVHEPHLSSFMDQIFAQMGGSIPPRGDPTVTGVDSSSSTNASLTDDNTSTGAASGPASGHPEEALQGLVGDRWRPAVDAVLTLLSKQFSAGGDKSTAIAAATMAALTTATAALSRTPVHDFGSDADLGSGAEDLLNQLSAALANARDHGVFNASSPFRTMAADDSLAEITRWAAQLSPRDLVNLTRELHLNPEEVASLLQMAEAASEELGVPLPSAEVLPTFPAFIDPGMLRATLLRRLNDTSALVRTLRTVSALAPSLARMASTDQMQAVLLQLVLFERNQASLDDILGFDVSTLGPAVVDELASWNGPEVLLAVTLFEALSAFFATAEPVSVERTQLWSHLFSRDHHVNEDGRREASAVRVSFHLGHPLPGYHSDSFQLHGQREKLRTILWPAFEQLLQEWQRENSRLRLSWNGPKGFIEWLGFKKLRSDLVLAVVSLLFVYALITLHTRSLFLGTMGVVQILASFPVALSAYVAFYRYVVGNCHHDVPFAVMHIISIYVVLGIGCDDLFVLLDAWNQAAWMAPSHCQSSIEGRMLWAYRRATRAMCITTLTNMVAFLSTTICVVPNLRSFAVLTSLLCFANFALVCTLWPCVLVLHERYLGSRTSSLINCGCDAPQQRNADGLAASDGAAVEWHTATRSGVCSDNADADEAVSKAQVVDSAQLHSIPVAQATGSASEMRTSNSLTVSPPPSPPACGMSGLAEASSSVCKPVNEVELHDEASFPSTPHGCSTDSGTPSTAIIAHEDEFETPPMPRASSASVRKSARSRSSLLGSARRSDCSHHGDGSHRTQDGGSSTVQCAQSEADVSMHASRRSSSFFGVLHVAKPRHLWRRSNHVRRTTPKQSRIIERWYAELYAPFLIRGRNAIGMVVTFGIIALIMGFKGATMQPARRDIALWPREHNAYRYLDVRDREFELINEQVAIVWGVTTVDRATADSCDEDDLGTVVWDDSFDASEPAAQVALLRGCREPPQNSALHIVPNSTDCLMGALHDWVMKRPHGPKTWPLEPERFFELLKEFLIDHPRYSTHISATADATGTLRLTHVVASFRVAVERHAPASRRRPMYEAWQAELKRLNDAAPPSANRAFQSGALMWLHMAVQDLLLFYAKTCIVGLTFVGFLILLLTTRSARLAAICMVTICAILATFTGCMVWFWDLDLGLVESVLLMVAVGLVLDPLTHIAHAFNEASGSSAQRLRTALTTIGISVLAGALSTAGSCVPLFGCTLVLFPTFGHLICTLMLVTTLYTNCLLAPLLFLLGPSDADVPAASREQYKHPAPTEQQTALTHAARICQLICCKACTSPFSHKQMVESDRPDPRNRSLNAANRTTVDLNQQGHELQVSSEDWHIISAVSTSRALPIDVETPAECGTLPDD